jgi:DNA-binding MarR family transcriptional regulator
VQLACATLLHVKRTQQGEAGLSEDEVAAWKGMLRAHRDLVVSLDGQLEREHSLPLSSYEVLMVLADSADGRARMGELAQELLLSRSGLTRLVDRLVRQGWVERAPCEDDARGLYAAITRAGRAKLKTARPAHLDGVRESFLSKLSDGDLDALARAWVKLDGRGAGQAVSGTGSPTSKP